MDCLSTAQTHELRKVFRKLADEYAQSTGDTSEKDIIGKDEVQRVMDLIGVQPTEDELVDMIASVDVDGTGHIDEAEFINMMTKKLRDCSKSCLLAQELQLEHTQTKLLFEHAEPHSELQETFDYFDADKDSKISAADLCKAATKLGMDVTEAEAETMLEEGSAETGGTFRFETLHKLMEASIPEKEQVKLRNEFQESKHNDEEEETKAGENE